MRLIANVIHKKTQKKQKNRRRGKEVQRQAHRYIQRVATDPKTSKFSSPIRSSIPFDSPTITGPAGNKTVNGKGFGFAVSEMESQPRKNKKKGALQTRNLGCSQTALSRSPPLLCVALFQLVTAVIRLSFLHDLKVFKPNSFRAVWA